MLAHFINKKFMFKYKLYKFHLSINKFVNNDRDYPPSFFVTAVSISSILIIFLLFIYLLLHEFLKVRIFFAEDNAKLTIISVTLLLSVINYFGIKKHLEGYESKIYGNNNLYANIYRIVLFILTLLFVLTLKFTE